MTIDASVYFLPYQRRWLADKSRFKIARKSRRTGLTYVQAFEDVTDAAKTEGGMDVWFSSADETAAKEYILYCAMWAKILDLGARDLGEIVIDEKNAIKALSIQFASGFRINALTSNPKAFRSKGGKLVLDEFAFHGDGEAMWKAARPIITWGYPVRIISTLNGKGNRYYRIVSDTEKQIALGKEPTWSLHTITIQSAVAEGLADKIVGRALTDVERTAWLATEEAAVGDDDTWRQEYGCEAIDDDTHWLSWPLIVGVESAEAGKPELYEGGDCYVGWDVARRRDGSIMWVDEQVGDVAVTRKVVRLKGQKFSDQYHEMDLIFTAFKVRRLCIDQTGMGEKVVEDMQDKYPGRVEGVIMTGVSKLHLATLVKQHFEDKRARIPQDRLIRDAHHAVKKTNTIAGNPRFDAERTAATGHSDEFWANALAKHAAENVLPPPAGATVEANDDSYRPDALTGAGGGGLFGSRANRTSAPGRPQRAPRRGNGAS